MTEPVRFNVVMTFRSTPAMNAAINAGARAKGVKPAEFLRQTILRYLDVEGTEATVTEESETQYALVADGKLSTVGVDRRFIFATKIDADDIRDWRPIENEDSEPFDPKLHWRLGPFYRIEPNRVVRVFPIVAKSMEHA